MIDPAALTNLANSVEKLIVLYLATAYRPMRLHEIVKALGIGRKNCSKSLKSLTERGIIIKQIEFGNDFYGLGLREESSGLREESSGLREESSGLRKESSGLRKESSGLRKVPPVAPQPPSKTPSNKQTKILPNKERNKEREIKNENADAEVSNPPPLPGEPRESVQKPSKPPQKPPRTPRHTGLLIKTESERNANRTARRATQTVMSREYANEPNNGYKVDTYFHPHDPDFPVTLRIPIALPKEGSFDGIIYAAALDRERTLDRMIHLIGIDKETDAVDTVISNRYDFFVSQINGLYHRLCGKKKGDGLVHDLAYNMRDDVIHRLAFAFAMAPKGLRTQADRENFLEDCKNRTSEKYKIWTPVIGKLRPIYFHQEWGWDSELLDIDETWRIELKHHSHSPRLILFPAKMYRDTYQEKKQNEKAEAVMIQQKRQEKAEAAKATVLSDETGLKILDAIKSRIAAGQSDMWLGDAACQFDGKMVTFVVRNDHAVKSVKRCLSDAIESAITSVLDGAVAYRIIDRDKSERLRIAADDFRLCSPDSLWDCGNPLSSIKDWQELSRCSTRYSVRRYIL